jgi:hypothetical protein
MRIGRWRVADLSTGLKSAITRGRRAHDEDAPMGASDN